MHRKNLVISSHIPPSPIRTHSLNKLAQSFQSLSVSRHNFLLPGPAAIDGGSWQWGRSCSKVELAPPWPTRSQ